jgi:hypothetical protein
MFVIVTGVTACAVNPALINWFKMIVRMPFGASVEQEKVTFIHQGISDKYGSVDGLLSKNNFNVYYPSALPKNNQLECIEVVDEDGLQILSFRFTSPDLHYTIQLNKQDYKCDQSFASEIESNGFHFNVFSLQDCYIAYSEIDGSIYIIQSCNIEDIIVIVGSLRKADT